MVRRISVLRLIACVFVALILMPGPAAAELPNADLAILRITGPHHTRVGHQATFRVTAVNNGPDTSQLDITPSFSGGLELVGERCDFGISADGPSCEYGNIVPGRRVTTVLVFAVLPGAEPSETITVCTGNEGQTVDGNSSNDCDSMSVKVDR